jgi:hydrogenase maturation factor
MKFKDNETRLLFLKYAIPCSETLARRGVITKKYQRNLMRAVFFNKKIPENSENIFKVAGLMCEKTARGLGKKSIDQDVIRKYFLFRHDRVVDKRYKIFKDFDPIQCRLYSGKISSLKKRVATVQTIIGKRNYKTDISKSLSAGDFVVVHRDFIIEKIDENLAQKLWRQKEIYFKSNKIKI